jgi:UDP-arabinose 4-epimerase
MTKVIVFGGAGYIGSHTCKELKANGFDPVTFDNLSEGHAEFVKWGDLIIGDVCDPEAVATAIERVKPVAVIHFAAHAYVGQSVSEPAKYYANNVVGSLSVLQALRAAGNIPIVFSSTCAIYGSPTVPIISENLPKAPINPYGRTKLMVEQILQDFSTAYGLKSVALRYFNAAGDDAALETGEAHREETHLIPRAILAGLGLINNVCVFGDDYDTPDGSAVRDYIHVTDLGRAHVAACRYLLDGGATEQFNVGVGVGHSVFEIVEAVERHLMGPVPHTIEARRVGDPPKLVADAAKIREVLGFETVHSSLDNIVSSAVAWHRIAPPLGKGGF